MTLKPHNHYSFREIQEALRSIGKQELCCCFLFDNRGDEIHSFNLAAPQCNHYLRRSKGPRHYNSRFFDSYETANVKITELIAALRSFGITEDKILVVSFD